jgi:F420H(2)-dependent quinone reductase
LRDDTFWILTEHGYAPDYLKNIQLDPRVRVNVGGPWYSGTAKVRPDLPEERLRRCGGRSTTSSCAPSALNS